jgi:lipid-binding SYLF domain-containing protein
MRVASMSCFAVCVLAAASSWVAHSAPQPQDNEKLVRAGGVLHTFTTNDAESIPRELLERARGIAVIPGMIRGGFLIGGRRGRGVLTVRGPTGEWSNPAFITLTGGSIGGQLGAESADVVLIFANDRSIKNIASGKFTLGGDASAVAGPLGARSTKAVTMKSEVYIYVRSRGLYAGAAFEGARLDVDQEGSATFYAADDGTHPLGEVTASTPESARRFLDVLDNVTVALAMPGATPQRSDATAPQAPQEEAVTFPLE